MSVDHATSRKRERHTLAGRYYRDADVFQLEFDRIFAKAWFCVGRNDAVRSPGGYVALEVVDQPIVVLRDRNGVLRAFHNVCRHRGNLLCEPGRGSLGTKNSITCPYHAWTYRLDGRLVGTPRVRRDEINREEFGLIPIRVEEWQGCLFVNLSGDAPSLEEWLDEQSDEPRSFEKWNLGDLRVAHTSAYEVAANWKILVENYHECLHCPTIHPEFVALIPAYRDGSVVEEGRDDYGVSLTAEARAMTASGTTTLPTLPGLSQKEALSVYGAYVFPNATVDIEGTFATLKTIMPRAVDKTILIHEYLFAPETMAEEGFDPSDVIEFNELVISQDVGICERVQRGVISRAFAHGVYAEKDAGPYGFDRRYLRFMASDSSKGVDTLAVQA